MRTGRLVGSKADCRRPASMREKSSRAVDEPQEPQRASMHGLESSRLAATPRGVGERILERAEDQRQRRAELVADVAEERGLRAVELGELLGALALLLVGAGVGHGGRDVAGDELEEAPVVVVEGAPRADRRATSTPAGSRAPGARDRQDHRLARRLVPRLLGRQSNRVARSSTTLRAPMRSHRAPAASRRRRGAADRPRAGSRRVPGSRPAWPARCRRLPAASSEVDEGEGDVARVAPEDLGAEPGGFVGRSRLDGHLAQRLHAALAEDARRALGARVEDAARAPRLVADRAVREREVASPPGSRSAASGGTGPPTRWPRRSR